MASLNDYLALIRPRIAPELISDRAWVDINPLAESLPGALAFSAFGFERPLDQINSRVDFLCSLDKANSGPEILAGLRPDSSRAWEQANRFGRAWADPTSPLHRRADDVWLEFDARRRPAGPSLFFGPRFPDRADQADSAADLTDLLEIVHQVLFNQGPSDDLAQPWVACLSRLPRPAALFQIGFMLPRPGRENMRVCVSLRAAELAPFLTGLWPGDLDEITTLTSELTDWFNGFAVHLDLGSGAESGIGPGIGLECRFDHRRGPGREPGWPGFIDYLVRRNLCRPDLAPALLSYPGHEPTDRSACPPELGALIDRLELSQVSFFVRKIFHIKLSLAPGRTWRAKAYLGVGHLWKNLTGGHEVGRGRWGMIGRTGRRKRKTKVGRVEHKEENTVHQSAATMHRQDSNRLVLWQPPDQPAQTGRLAEGAWAPGLGH